jgi:hypothetical protein
MMDVPVPRPNHNKSTHTEANNTEVIGEDDEKERIQNDEGGEDEGCMSKRE